MKTYKKEEINEVREDLLHGKIIAFPTDTVFGLACVYDDLNAIHKIYEAKGRDIPKSLPMMCSSFEMIEEVVRKCDMMIKEKEIKVKIKNKKPVIVNADEFYI